MSSTYSTSLRIQLITTGTENEAWGAPTDNNFGTIIEQAITGVNSISLTNLTSLTLSTANAAIDESRNAVLVFTGAPTANCNVIAPSVNKVYIVSNQTTGGYNVNMQTSGGDPLVVAAGSKQLIFCNGTAFSTVADPNAINGNLTVIGSETAGGNVTVGTNVFLNRTVTGTAGNLSLNSISNIVSFQQNTGALSIPSGTTGQRPTNKALGMQRWNSDIGVVEVWNGSTWIPITGSTQGVYLVVGGGGAGGSGSFSAAGGGGAGGLLTGTFYANVATSYSIVVGAGGTTTGSYDATNGANSTAFGVTAIGGGYGAYGPAYSVGSGGSGGGGAATASVGSGTSGQGFAGGAGRVDPFRGGGGGGASAAGGGGNSGQGGDGIQSSITGTATYYAGGGGGGGCTEGGGQDATLPGAGGLGGGGYGGYGGPTGSGSIATAGVAGTAGTGGGGGGGARIYQYGLTSGGNGGSGVVIAAYASSYQKATGGTITTYTTGGVQYYVHTFTTSGTLAF